MKGSSLEVSYSEWGGGGPTALKGGKRPGRGAEKQALLLKDLEVAASGRLRVREKILL